MRALGRLLFWYLCAGVVIAVLDNWIAHANSGSSILEVITSAAPPGEKAAAFYNLVLFPILAWPVRIMALIRGGS